MWKRMLVMIVGFSLVIGGITWLQFSSGMKKMRQMMGPRPPTVISTVMARSAEWQDEIRAVGTLRAARGVDVAAEVSGKVDQVYCESGDTVAEGDVLLQLNDDVDLAQLAALETAVDLAQSVYSRSQKQFEAQSLSQAALDAASADLRVKQASLAAQKALFEKRKVLAPFAGRLGISRVNPGQYVNAGEALWGLQDVSNLKIDIHVPQQQLPLLKTGDKAQISVDAFPGRAFEGRISAVDPMVDEATRNLHVEVTLPNPDSELLPGMFVRVVLPIGQLQKYIVLPQAAVTYNPYGDTVYVLEEKSDAQGKTELQAKQVFITTGQRRGDLVSVLKGVQEGDVVVSAGQMKLRNGSAVAVNNSVQPAMELAPNPADK